MTARDSGQDPRTVTIELEDVLSMIYTGVEGYAMALDEKDEFQSEPWEDVIGTLIDWAGWWGWKTEVVDHLLGLRWEHPEAVDRLLSRLTVPAASA